MKLSERGAINSAIADGGFHLYPAGKLMNIIKAGLEGDALQGDFDPTSTAEKLKRVSGPSDSDERDIFEKDLTLLVDRLSGMSPDYDIERVFAGMPESLPALAKRYYGIDNFESTKPSIVEYYFEGYTDIYKDADWSAFNVNSYEAKDLNVPVGIYFKRSQVTPGIPEYVCMHEANHVMQEAVALPRGYHSYIPWMDEGFADAIGRMMLFRATEDETLIKKVKTFRTEVDVIDPRKVTYHYGEQTAIMTLIRGRLPFARTLMGVRQNEPFSVNWNLYANLIREGIDPHIAIVKAYIGKKLDAFRKKLERDEKKFRGEADLDQTDLRILSNFIATQAPATLDALEYKASLWITEEATKRPNPHFVDPEIIPEKFRGKVSGWNEKEATPAGAIPSEVWEKAPETNLKILIAETDIPEQFKEGINKLAAMYFVIRRPIGEKMYFEPYGGGLPYRLGTGELRCGY